jgi:hypothetical protein
MDFYEPQQIMFYQDLFMPIGQPLLHHIPFSNGNSMNGNSIDQGNRIASGFGSIGTTNSNTNNNTNDCLINDFFTFEQSDPFVPL